MDRSARASATDSPDRAEPEQAEPEQAEPEQAEYEQADREPNGPDRSGLGVGAAVGGVVALGTIAIAAVNPGDSGAPICLSQTLFGIDCPLCGGLRAVNALARGDWLAAADHNVVLAVVLPLAVAAWLWWMVSAWRGRRVATRAPSASVVVGVVVLLVAFTVLRNIDAGPVTDWLAASRSV